MSIRVEAEKLPKSYPFAQAMFAGEDGSKEEGYSNISSPHFGCIG